MRIRRRPKNGRAIGENLGRRAQLAMRFQTDYGFILSFGGSGNRHNVMSGV